MDDQIKLSLKYEGNAVKAGVMEVEDIANALLGFSKAYSKILNRFQPDAKHKMRVVSLQKGSFEVFLDVADFIIDHKDTLQGMAPILGGVGSCDNITNIMSMFISLIKLKKHTKKKKYTTNINSSNGTVIVNNIDNLTIELPETHLSIFAEGIADKDLDQIVKPLVKGNVDSTSITLFKNDEIQYQESINYSEKPYFEIDKEEVKTTKEIELDGKLDSLKKSTNSGRFILVDGTTVGYHLIMDKPENYYQHFLHKGPVRMKCIAELNESLKPIRLQVQDIIDLQPRLFNENND